MPGLRASSEPTKVRYGVLGFVCTLSAITYLDRAAFPNAEKSILAALGLETIDELWLAMAVFQLAYALFEVPTGWLGDTFGPRKTLIRIVLWWSFFVGLTGLVGQPIAGVVIINYTVLVIIRFLFGMGEAGAYPNIARALTNWLPLTERGFGQGLVWMSARLMGGLTPLIWLLLTHRSYLDLDWRWTFALFGALGVVWCAVFVLFFRDRPEEHPAVNEAERDLIRHNAPPQIGHSGVPWGILLRSRNLWFIGAMYFCTNYGWYFNMYFLPGFLRRYYEQNGIPDDSILGALGKGGPMILGIAGCLIGGWLTDHLLRRSGDRRWSRRIPGMLGYALSGLCYLCALGAASEPVFLVVLIALVGFSNDLTMGASWATCQDVGRRYTAIVSGFMNMIGNLGGVLTIFVTGQVLKWAQANPGYGHEWGFRINFVLYAAVYFVGVLLWLQIDANKPVVPEEQDAPPEPSV
jgi:MFS transporter, ACS family, glucarate transporter